VCIPLFSDVSYLSTSCLLSLFLYSVLLFFPLVTFTETMLIRTTLAYHTVC
jgi:hypothetical protein